jgi:hypothetical protein
MSIITINNNTYDTFIKEERLKFGLDQEKYFFKYLNDNKLNYIHISNENAFSFFDFFKINDETEILLELKSRNQAFDISKVSLIDANKVRKFDKLKKNKENLRFIFIFNFCNNETSLNEYWYYEISNFKKMANIIFMTDCFGMETMELSNKYLTRLDKETIKILI